MTDTNILDHPIISERYFFPRKASIPAPFWVDCDGARLGCSYHETDAEALTLVHFHGNGEIVSDYLEGFPELIARMGCNCFLAEFRGYGSSTGTPQLGKMLLDVQPTIDALGKPPEKLVLFGRSVGSLFATKALENFPQVAGLVLESAIANPLERLLLRVHPGELATSQKSLEEAVEEQINIRKALHSFPGPVLIMHTRHDGLIDVNHAEQLAAWCQGPVHLEIFPQGNHNDIMFRNGPRYFSLLNQFLAGIKV